MIRFIILAIAFLTVIAFSPLLINEKGYLLIAMGDLTIESTVVTALIMLVISFIALLLLIKLVRNGFKFSSLTWHKVIFSNRRKALSEFYRGIAAYLLRDYVHAEHLLAKCAKSSGLEKLAWLIAAAAANNQRDNKNAASNSAHYLTLIEQCEQNSHDDNNILLATLLVKLDLLMQQKAYVKARELLDANHKLIGHDSRLLAFEIDLSIEEQRYSAAAQYLQKARKPKNITPERIAQWEHTVFSALFTEKIIKEDQQALHDYWRSLANKVKQSDAVLLAYCQVLATNNLVEPINKLLLPRFKKEFSSEFAKQLRLLPLSNAEALIIAVQKQLQDKPNSAKWLSLLAHLAYRSEQWSMADKAFYRLVNLPEKHYDQLDIITYAKVKSRLGLHEQANELLLSLVTEHCD
jgi:HemY protein